MGLFSWLFGGGKKEEPMAMSAGGHQTQSAPKPMGGMESGNGMHKQHSGAESGTKTAKDPVCGMKVDTEKAAATSVFEGTTYYFCRAGCKRAFDEDPSKYLGNSGHTKEGMQGGGNRDGCC